MSLGQGVCRAHLGAGIQALLGDIIEALTKMVTMCKVFFGSQPEVLMYKLCLILTERVCTFYMSHGVSSLPRFIGDVLCHRLFHSRGLFADDVVCLGVFLHHI